MPAESDYTKHSVLVSTTLPPDSRRTFRLEDAEVVFVDGIHLMEAAFKKGVARTARVLSSSPGTLIRASALSEPVDSCIGPDDFRRLHQTVRDATLEIHATLSEIPALADIAIVVTRSVTTSSIVILKAMCLRNYDFEKRSVNAVAATGDKFFDIARSALWDRLIPPPHLRLEIPVSRETLQYDFDTDRQHPGFLWRLRATGWPRLGFRLWRDFWDRVSWTPPKGTILVHKENALLRETAYFLANHGYALRTLKLPHIHQAPDSQGLFCMIRENVIPAFRKHFDEIVPLEVRPRLLDVCLERIQRDVDMYRAARSGWRIALDKRHRESVKAVLINAPNRPTDVALFHQCREAGVPLISFQHGVSKEIDAHRDAMDCANEIASSDLFLTFNRRSTELSRAIPFASGSSETIGLPNEYWRTGKVHGRTARQHPILFVSTQLFSENTNVPLYKWVTDREMADREIALIERVLMFKPYPEHRYLDPDPVIEAVRRSKRIDFHDRGMDLSYMLSDARIIITSRATSTLGWCLLAGKPVVFLDLHLQSPLQPDAKERLREALFLFEDSSSTFYDDVRAFLSQPLESVESAWQEKEDARSRAIEEFFGTGGTGSGRRGAQLVHRSIVSRFVKSEIASRQELSR
jgi:hypothetical protein